MRRWTVMFIPHDTESPRSISVSERGLRIGASVAVAVLLIALIGLGGIIAQFGQVRQVGHTRLTSAPRAFAWARRNPEVDSLRRQVDLLHGRLDTIRMADGRLRNISGVPTPDSVTLLRRWFPRVPLFPRGSGTRTPNAATPSTAIDSAGLRAVLSGSRASTDSLLRHAAEVAERMGTLADSALATRKAGRSGVRPR